MIYVLWYKFKGPDAPWLACEFSSDRARGQFIARHRRALDSWAVEGVAPGSDLYACPLPGSLPPGHLTVHRQP